MTGTEAKIRVLIIAGIDLAEISTRLLVRFSDVAAIARQIEQERIEKRDAETAALVRDASPAKIVAATDAIRREHESAEARGPYGWRSRSRERAGSRAVPVAASVPPLPLQHGFEIFPE